jgi:hypothetical protein
MAGDPDSPTPRQGRDIVGGPTNTGPRMRAWAPKDVLENIDEYRPGTAEQLRREIPWRAWESLQETRKLEWIAVREGREVAAAVWRVLGHDEAFAFFRWLFPREVTRPVIRGIMRTSIRLFGLSPASFVRAVRGGWGMAFQEVGEPVVSFPGLRVAVFELQGVPTVATEEPAYLQSVAGSFCAFFDLCGVDGGVDLDIDEDRARFTFSW